MHRPGIALVRGKKIILNGTTIEEVERYHTEAVDKYTMVEVSSSGREFTIIEPRENLGSYIIDLDKHVTRLTRPENVIKIKKGGSGNFLFNYKLNKKRDDDWMTFASFKDKIETNWIISYLVISYLGKNNSYLLKGDLKKGIYGNTVSF